MLCTRRNRLTAMDLRVRVFVGTVECKESVVSTDIKNFYIISRWNIPVLSFNKDLVEDSHIVEVCKIVGQSIS